MLDLNEHALENINRCRKLLKNLEENARQVGITDSTYAFTLGQIREATKRAEESLFDVLNLVHSTGHATLTEEQLHPHGVNYKTS